MTKVTKIKIKEIFLIDLIFVLLLIGIDLFFKSITNILDFLDYDLIKITPAINYGSAFNSFEGIGYYLHFVTFLSVLVTLYLIYTYIKESKSNSLNVLERSFIILAISGIIGNLFDRIVFGHVRDFIQIKYFPAIFNIADLYLSFGVIVFFVMSYKDFKRKFEKRKNS